MRKIAAFVMLLLVALPVTGGSDALAQDCHSSEISSAMSMMQDAGCPEHLKLDGTAPGNDHSCQCSAMMSCVAALLPDASLDDYALPESFSAYLPFEQTPTGYQAGLVSPPPRKMI